MFLSVAAGYVRAGGDRIEKDPDKRVQEALSLVFAKFAEFHSVRQVHVWLRDEGIALPVACHRAAEGRSIVWKLPLYNTVHNILTNPVYAGAYAFGRTMSKVSVEDGRKRVKRGLRRPQSEWDVLLKDQHEGYITWSEFERNQRVIANNATGKGSAVTGAVRRGERGFYAVVIAAAKSMSAMVAKRGAIIARALSSTMALRGASPSAACVPIMPSAQKCCGC